MTAAGGVKGVTPYIAVKGAAKAIEFYARAFGAKEAYRLTAPDGSIGHAEIDIGSSRIMLSDEAPDFGAISPQTLGGTPVKFHVAVENADKAVARAVEAGAAVLRPVQDQFFGERSGMVADPFGHQWFLSQHIRDVSPAEMQKLFDDAFKT